MNKDLLELILLTIFVIIADVVFLGAGIYIFVSGLILLGTIYVCVCASLLAMFNYVLIGSWKERKKK